MYISPLPQPTKANLSSGERPLKQTQYLVGLVAESDAADVLLCCVGKKVV